MNSRIAITDTTNAPDATKPLLESLRRNIGMVPNVYAVIGHSPGSLESVLAWGNALSRSGLSKREIEQLNLHISELNGCAYCVCAHSALGSRAGLSEEGVDRARQGAGSSERENAILAFARRVVRTGGSRAGSELARLRETGVADAEIIDILAVVALNVFRNAVNIVARTEIDFPKARELPSD